MAPRRLADRCIHHGLSRVFHHDSMPPRFASPGLLSRLGAHELAMIVGVSIVTGCSWVFVKLGGEVREGETMSIDTWLLRAFRNPRDLHDAIGPAWFENSVRDITALGSMTIISLIMAV